jgi:hypothetical protein
MAAIVPREIGEWPSPAGLTLSGDFRRTVQTDMAIRGDKAFLGVKVIGQPGHFLIFDLGQGPNPVKLGQLELSSSNRLQSISISGNIALVGDRFTPSAIDIVDISDLTQPKLAGVLFHPNPSAYIVSVTAHQNLAYLYGPASELAVANLSNPSSPQIIRTLPHKFSDFFVDGSRGFAIGSSGLTVFDLTDPTNPTVLGKSSAIAGSTILVSGSVGFVGTSSSLLAVDLQNPTAPKLISSKYAEAGITGLAKRGNLLADSGRLFDVTNPTNILNAGWLGVFGTVRAGPDAFIAFSPDSGLRVVNSTDPKNPKMRGFYPLGSARPHIRPGDSHVYFTFHDLDLVIVDFSNIANPVVVSQLDLPYSPDRIAFNRDVAYVFQGSSVTLVDISDPRIPVANRTFPVASVSAFGSAQIHNDRLYVYAPSRLNVYDVKDTNTLPLVDTISDVYSYQVFGSVLYTSHIFPQTLRVWDIADPSNRKLLVEYPDYGGSSMAVAADRLVVSGTALWFFDILPDGKLSLIEKFASANGRVTASGNLAVTFANDEISLFEIPEIGLPRRSSVLNRRFPDLDQVVFFGPSLFVHSLSLGTKIFDLVTEPGPMITSPTRAATYQSGQTLPITWAAGPGPHDWAVSLYAPPRLFSREIAIIGPTPQITENTYQLDWQIPAYIETWASGDAYQIVVRDRIDGAQGFSDPFTIIDLPKLSFIDQRYDQPPRIYVSWPSRFNDSYILYFKESLDAEWKPETVNTRISEPDSFHRIEGDELALPQKFFNLLPKTP